MRVLALGVAGSLLVACGGGSKPPATAEGDPSVVAEPNPEGTAPANAEPGPAAAIEQPVKKKYRPYEIVNLCPSPVTLLYGPDPKAPTLASATLAGNARIDGPRDSDGNQIIWLMVRGQALVTVHVSRGTKRVEVGTSCDTLEMH